MSSQRRVFIISLDGATFSVLNRLIQQGYMPNVGALMSRSAVRELESVIPPVTAPAWTSFMTGKHPNKHGILDFSHFNPDTYSWGINNARNIKSKTLWQILSDRGRRVIVLNLPYTYPPYPVNGILVSGWDAPFTEKSFSEPACVSEQILQRFEDYKTNLWVSALQPLRSDGQFHEFTNRLKKGFEQQAQIAIDLLSQEPWDVFMVHFQQTDWIQHKLWNWIERACVASDDHSETVEATRDCYRHFDEWVGNLLERVDSPQVWTILLSDHGFGRLMGNINANQYLKEWGYLSVLPQAEDRFADLKKLIKHSQYEPLRRVYRSVAAARKHRIASDTPAKEHDSWADNAQSVMKSRGATWDWERTKAALVYAYQMGFVYINVRGRGPQGIVDPGQQYEAIVADLLERFAGLRHPLTGQKLLQAAVRVGDVYPPARNSVFLPDIVLIPVDGYGFAFSLSEAPPAVSEEGTHRHNGVLVMCGEGVTTTNTGPTPNLIDVAPTILNLLGLPVPSDMDGRVLESLVDSGSPVRYEEVDSQVVSFASAYDPEEEDIVAQRLKGLGYLD